MSKKNQGFTLVELLVTISVGALVTLAATTVILMGLRLNRQSMGTATRQNTARILLTALEDLASDGSVSGFRMDYEDWEIYGEETKPAEGEMPAEYKVLYAYDADKHEISTNGAPIMKNVLSSYLEYEDDLLTISVETDEGIFNSTVYCRMAISPSGMSGSDKEEDTPTQEDINKDDLLNPEIQVSGVPNAVARRAFLEILISQYRITKNQNGETVTPAKNYGVILDDGQYTDKYYSWWYITSDGEDEAGMEAWDSEIWNSATPWCACFVTWGVKEALPYTNYAIDDNGNLRPVFAGVDSFMAYFRNSAADSNEWHTSRYWLANGEEDYPPLPGDVIFYDWVLNEERDPQHVGVVLGTTTENVDGEMVDYVYTIEGNVSDGTGSLGVVGLRKYALDDPRILGYGVLDWADDTTS